MLLCKTADPEIIEQENVKREMEEASFEEGKRVERIVKKRACKRSETAPDGIEYYVKWSGRPYSACTWEGSGKISDAVKEIEELQGKTFAGFMDRLGKRLKG